MLLNKETKSNHKKQRKYCRRYIVTIIKRVVEKQKSIRILDIVLLIKMFFAAVTNI